ncbi:hypothetical protein MOMA_04345 [Moraxella macacae 0408225]|uniref:Uncharacterized protein n=1 Tax=Moraxella macacae 0408225 TaxID=1230338 RepID=L2F9P3_9GAMM|nr:hypothetical protein [Moraxella macacae]ELA09605.1 hypothetical protein MOMA_04345 [Moraxella macacae 0408225]
MTIHRLQPLLIAGLLPLLIFAWFIGGVAGQVDFWLLWLVAMTLVGLPLVFAEIALAYRSGTTPLIGLSTLTREADVATIWRGFGWLTVLLLLAVVGHLLNSSATILQLNFLPISTVATPALLAIIALITLGLSFAKQLTGWLAMGLATVAFILNIAQNGIATWQMTATSLSEWSLAVVLALVCVGAGTGLFWHSHANQLLNRGDVNKDHKKDHKSIASRIVLPIWCFQIIGGILVALALPPTGQISAICYALAMMAGASYLLHLITYQVSLKISQQSFNFLISVIVLVIALGLAMLPSLALNHLVAVFSLFAGIWLAIFAGWQMKISHLRKSLNFSSEIVYNLWRIAVRIVIPLAIVLAFIGWIIGLAK